MSIGTSAFSDCNFKGELALPKNLTVINDNVFYNCDFSGELVLPKNLVTIGDKAFAYNWRLMGTLEFGEGLLTIGAVHSPTAVAWRDLCFLKALKMSATRQAIMMMAALSRVATALARL